MSIFPVRMKTSVCVFDVASVRTFGCGSSFESPLDGTFVVVSGTPRSHATSPLHPIVRASISPAMDGTR